MFHIIQNSFFFKFIQSSKYNEFRNKFHNIYMCVLVGVKLNKKVGCTSDTIIHAADAVLGYF